MVFTSSAYFTSLLIHIEIDTLVHSIFSLTLSIIYAVSLVVSAKADLEDLLSSWRPYQVSSPNGRRPGKSCGQQSRAHVRAV